MKSFTTTGICNPAKHYMVDISERVKRIRAMVDRGEYFTINRARQYGKTTTLNVLAAALRESYYVVFLDFQDYGYTTFESENSFCRDFLYDFCAEFRRVSEGCATNNQIFLDFLAGLRSQYIKREKSEDYKTFKSVILAGVTDVKHLKSKIRDDGQHKVNSPWNIAADFDIDMSLSADGIANMLDTSEAMGQKFAGASDRWTKYGVDDAQKQLFMYGFLREDHNTVMIANRIFETLLYNHFLGENTEWDGFKKSATLDKNIFVKGDALDMPLIMERFIATYDQIFGSDRDRFNENDGRELFLLYLKPIINGTGNYYIEAQTRDQKRTDIIVDYLGHQYIIELKIWRGEQYNTSGEYQLIDYLEHWKLDTGYMLTFNFNKGKKQGVEKVCIGEKTVYEAVV